MRKGLKMDSSELPKLENIPTFMKFFRGEMIGLQGVQPANLTIEEKVIIAEQFEPWLEAKGFKPSTLTKELYAEKFEVFASGYMSGLLFGTGGVHSMYHLQMFKN